MSVCIAIGFLLPAALVVSWRPYDDKREVGPLLEKMRLAMQPATTLTVVHELTGGTGSPHLKVGDL